MPTFIPPYLGEEIKSNAEKKMYNVLQELDLKYAYILHSLGLPKHNHKAYGEIDFVIVCEYGVACLEIKGGRVECRDGNWYFIDRYGIERTKHEGPFAQVVGNMYSLDKILKDKFHNSNRLSNIAMACGVVFPDIRFEYNGQECIPEITFDKSTSDITEYIKNIFGYWEKRKYKDKAKLSIQDIKNIVNFLRGDFVFVPMLSDRLNDVERKLVRLTYEQTQLVQALSMNAHLMIEGKAGTGKTLLATDYAKKRAEEGKKVLYLTFNKNLSNNVNAQIGGIENLKVINIHALFGEYVQVDNEKLNANPSKYFSEELPEEVLDYLSVLSDSEIDQLNYDVLVMDEGQDILKPAYLYSLDTVLKGGFDKGYWAIFYDSDQNIYNPEYDAGMEIINGFHSAHFKLRINCRNTIQIGTYSSLLSGIKLDEFIRENGEEVIKLSYKTVEECKKKIDDILEEFKKENVSLRDVVFLAPHRYKNSILSKMEIEVNELGKPEIDKNIPYFSTIQGFKGLDSKIVILVDIETIKPENYSRFIYIAGTRARTLLYVVASDEFWNVKK